MTRTALRKALNVGGVATGRKENGEVATIVEFVDYWGVMPGVVGSGAELPDIFVALNEAGIGWEMGNMVLVPR